jgi:hypothetical protein
MLFFKSRFCHGATETQRGKAREPESQRDNQAIRPSVPPSLRPSVPLSRRLPLPIPHPRNINVPQNIVVGSFRNKLRPQLLISSGVQ